MTETLYTVMLTTTSHVVSAGAVQALQAARAHRRETIRVVPIGSCGHCRTPHSVVEIRLADVRAIVRHDADGSLALASDERVVPLRRLATSARTAGRTATAR